MTTEEATLSYRMMSGGFRLFFRAFVKMDIQGLDRMPKSGSGLVVANHNSIFEGPMILAFAPRQPISPVTKEEYRTEWLGRVLFRFLGPIYVKRGEVDRRALKEMLSQLKAGGVVGIAPEGTRSSSGKLIEGKEGPAYLALKTGVWIWPLAVWGQEDIIPAWKRGKRATVYMRGGEPFRLESEAGKSRQENIAAGTEQIMHAIARLLPPEYRGYYADAVQGEPVW